MPLLSMKTKTKLLMALGVYSATSYYFLRHPELLHRKKDKLKLPQLQADSNKCFQYDYVIAHRGGSLENPENTLQAFQHATDVRLTKDGELLTFHDADFHRLSGQDNSVNDTHYEQMPQIQDQIPLHFILILICSIKILIREQCTTKRVIYSHLQIAFVNIIIF